MYDRKRMRDPRSDKRDSRPPKDPRMSSSNREWSNNDGGYNRHSGDHADPRLNRVVAQSTPTQQGSPASRE